ncbi:MAG: amidohydrolase [Eubacteriaceae bacterium]|nr:amidohydrolase [Eubacteriaceae bacterium]
MDTILINGTVETMAGKAASAIAIKNGRIAYVGSDEEALKHKGDGTKVYDLSGRLALPGFTDTHIHTLHTGESMNRLDLRGVKSVEEIIEKGKEYVLQKDLKPGEWIVAFGFNQNIFDDAKLPSKEGLDEISTQNPIICYRICFHIAVVNSKAIEIAGISSDAKVSGGTLDLNENGELTGVLRENALELAHAAIPSMSIADAEGILASATQAMAESGITAVHSDDLSYISYEGLSEAVANAMARDELKVRIYEQCQCPSLSALEGLAALGLNSGAGSERFSAVCVKILADGSLGASTAYMLEPYSDDLSNTGIPIYEEGDLKELVKASHNAGFAVACHCIGDGALEMFLNAVEEAMCENPQPIVHRVVHCQVGNQQQYQRMASLNMAADIQPPFTATDSAIANIRLGDARTDDSYNWKSLLQHGVKLGGGSDSPVESFSPIWGIYCAVSRKNGAGGPSWLAGQCLSVYEAVSLYTVGAANIANAAYTSGTLETGKYADIVVLDTNIFQASEDGLRDAKPVMTIMGGSITYSNGDIA